MRESLDHCVKCTICETFCPVSNATPLFPGPKYVGPQAERFRVDDEPSFDASLDYCSGCGVCTQVCPQGVHIAEINTQARAKMKATKGMPLRDRVLGRPTLAGRLGTPAAPLANWSLNNRLVRLALERLIGIHQRAPMPAFAGRTFQRWAAQACAAGGGEAGRLLPRLRDELLRAAARRDDRRPARAQRLRGRGPEAGLLRVAAAVQRPVRRRARLRPPARGAAGALRARGRRHRRHLDELHADAQARGAGDPGHGRRPRAARRVAGGCSTSASTCWPCTSAASCRRISAPCPRPSPTTRRASSRATASASRHSTCSRWCPSCG